MMTSREARPWPRAVAVGAAVLVQCAGVYGLVLQTSGAGQRAWPGWSSMSALTAACFVLLGTSLLMVTRADLWRPQGGPRKARALRFSALGLAAVAATLALLRLGAHLVGLQLGLDGLGLAGAAARGTGASGATMSSATALGISLLAGELVCSACMASMSRPQWFALAGLLIGWLGLSRHIYGGEPLVPFSAMAWPTAFGLLILGTGTLLARSDGAFLALAQADTAGGTVVRRLLPMALLVPLALGWLRLQAQHAGWVGTESGLSLFALANVIVFGGMIWIIARRLDATDRQGREAVEHKLASQRLLQGIVDNSAAVIYAKDLDGRYLLVNHLYLKIFHRNREAVLGRTDHDFFDQQAADLFRSMDQRVADAGRPLIEEETAPLDDGLHTYLSVKCPLRDSEDRIVGTFGISTDITERRIAQARLESQLERLRLLDQITRSIGEHQDLLSIYQVAIRSLEDHLPADFSCLCRYDATDHTLTVVGVGAKSQSLAMALAMEEAAIVAIDANGLARCVSGELVYEPDIRAMPHPFPSRLAREGLGALVIAPLRSESRVFGVLVAARRAPESFSSTDCEFLGQLSAHVALAARQAELHGALQVAYDDLRRSQQGLLEQERLRALGQMASGIAHDINNAISPIMLYTESLLEREVSLSERGRTQLQTITRAIDDVAATIARLREFYRQHDSPSDQRPLVLNDIARQVIELTRARWQDMPQQRGAVVTPAIDLAVDLPAIRGSEAELREALINLVFNAVDAMPEGGTLTVRTHARTGYALPVVLEVADTGVGMDDATRQRCLEPFYTTKGERGTGLGLAMVYGTAQRHGAEIEIDSVPAHGTTVRLAFAAAGASAPAMPPPTAQPVRSLRILLVDDDPVVLKSLGETLAQDGHSVEAASGGQAGIDALSTAQHEGRPFDVVITDLGMPYVDGRRVAAAVKSVNAATPVIMLTGWGRRLASDGDVPPHVDLLLPKPPKLQSLRAALAHLTGPAANGPGSHDEDPT